MRSSGTGVGLVEESSASPRPGSSAARVRKLRSTPPSPRSQGGAGRLPSASRVVSGARGPCGSLQATAARRALPRF